ncbi:MAG: aldehyde ferredoxin oxidoreductase N-terminal domain-containing protein [bacterium]
MSQSKAYAGKILRVDLSTGNATTVETARYADRFVGGRGVATALYWEALAPASPYDDERNPIILSVGPLAGIPGALGGSRCGIFAKSPYPAAEHGGRDHFCYGNLGGKLGAELRFAGYDALVVTGKADGPVALVIHDDQVELRPADALWGRSTVETMSALQRESAPRSKLLAIGPAGEHLVPLATVFADGDASCSGGMGAAFGAKRLKALSVRGTRRALEVADREELRRIDHQIRSYHRGNVKVWGLDFMAHGPKTKKSPCFGCMAHCLRVRYTAADGRSGKFMCQSRYFYLNHAWGHYGEDTDVPFYANRACDEYGIDTWEVQALIEWLLRCRAEGILSAAECGLDFGKVGSLEFIEELVRISSLREGFGELLAQGARAASRARGGPAELAFARNDPYDPRYCTVNTLLFPFETREPIQQLHEAGLVLSQWSSWAKGVPEAHISSDVLRRIASRFWGSEQAADMTTLDGKAFAAKRIQERQLAKECLGLCDWMFPVIDVPTGPDHAGDPTLESRILTAVTGTPCSEAELYRVGERVFNLQRAILLREGHRARDDDWLPDEWHDQPIETHVADPDLLAPGPKGRVVSQLGRRARRTAFERVRDEYYELRGWDVPTGLPSREQLRALDLADVADTLAAQRLAVPRARPRSLFAHARHALLGLRDRAADGIAGRRARAVARAGSAERVSVDPDELMRILVTEQGKFGLEGIRHGFRGWNKTMQYHFPDLGAYYVIRFVDGEAQPPERLEGPAPHPEISYELDTWTLAEMSAGRLSGEKAYFKRRLRIKAAFADMMKLQSLNKV